MENDGWLAASINLSKLCIGTGLLALPLATYRGGLIFSPLGIAVIAVWNGIACDMMIRCKQATSGEQFSQLNNLSSTYSKIAYVGCGWIGVYIIDASIVITLLGVCITYQIAFSTLMKDILGNMLSHRHLTIISAIIVYPASCAQDISILTKYSIAGLVFLLIAIFTIFYFGFYSFGANFLRNAAVIPNFPKSLEDMITYSGVSIFCFGLCSLAFPIEETMSKKEDFRLAVTCCLFFVWLVYTVVGDGLAILYVQDTNGIQSNILQNLPLTSLTAALVKLSMAAVCLFTFPLTLVPPALMIEHLIVQRCRRRNDDNLDTNGIGNPNIEYQSINNDIIDEDLDTSDHGFYSTIYFSYINRLILVCFCTVSAIGIPCFGDIISLLGCFTVSILSFVMPPLLHYRIVTYPVLRGNRLASKVGENDFVSFRYQAIIDIVLTILGVLVSLIGSIINGARVTKNMINNAC